MTFDDFGATTHGTAVVETVAVTRRRRFDKATELLYCTVRLGWILKEYPDLE
ncbi:MAG: hypothetical protein VX262_10215 [Acidobacteriota bacterium]|nr:hypothetical protein [Acidobacteriota bacterium]